MKLNYRSIGFAMLLVAITTLTKYFFAPQLNMSGFSPLIAVALFSGIMIQQRNASFLLPLATLFISDVIIEVLYRTGKFPFAGFYKYQLLNYGLLMLTTLVGWAINAKKLSQVFIGSVAGATLFFLLSNFSVWFFGNHTTYSFDAKGLMACYYAGLPFYGRALLATVIFLPSILVAYNYIINAKTRVTLA